MTDAAAPAPPDQTVWWDEPATVAAVLDVLRLDEADPDAARVVGLVAAAGARINDVLDRVDPLPSPPPAPLANAIVTVTVELYRAKDAPPSSIDGLVAASWRPPTVDPVAAVRAMLLPYKQRFGVG